MSTDTMWSGVPQPQSQLCGSEDCGRSNSCQVIGLVQGFPWIVDQSSVSSGEQICSCINQSSRLHRPNSLYLLRPHVVQSGLKQICTHSLFLPFYPCNHSDSASRRARHTKYCTSTPPVWHRLELMYCSHHTPILGGFVARFQAVAAPVNSLLRKGNACRWRSEQQTVAPDPQTQFMLDIDGSNMKYEL